MSGSGRRTGSAARPLAVIGLLLAAGVAQALWFAPALPDPLASHFDFSGDPDGYSSRSTFLIITILVPAALAALFVWIPSMVRRLPDKLINLPNKDYWLAPERREATLDRLKGWLTWFGAVTVAFLVATFHLALRANLLDPPQLPVGTVWSLLGAYLALIAVLTFVLAGRFAACGRDGS